MKPVGMTPSQLEQSKKKPAIVYRLFNTEGQLLYVGSTAGTLKGRLREHERLRTWFPEVAAVTTEPYASRFEALIAERAAVESEAPLHNARLPITPEVSAIGSRIREARLALELNQSEFGRLLGVRQKTVCAWEIGQWMPSLELIPGIAAALGCTPAFLAFGDEAHATTAQAA